MMTFVMLLVIVASYLLMLGLVKFAANVIGKTPAAKLSAADSSGKNANASPL